MRRWRRSPAQGAFHWNIPVFCALLGIGLALFLIHRINGRIRPIMIDLACAQINNNAVRLLHKAVEEQPLPYDQVISLERDSDGRVVLLKSNMTAISAYRSSLVEKLIDSLDQLQTHSVNIPLGSLSGIELLSGRGPKIPVKVLSVGIVRTEFENLFTSAGINQTRHQVMLDITVDTKIIMPGIREQTEASTRICVAETVIVGATPEHFTYFDRNSDLL